MVYWISKLGFLVELSVAMVEFTDSTKTSSNISNTIGGSHYLSTVDVVGPNIWSDNKNYMEKTVWWTNFHSCGLFSHCNASKFSHLSPWFHHVPSIPTVSRSRWQQTGAKRHGGENQSPSRRRVALSKPWRLGMETEHSPSVISLKQKVGEWWIYYIFVYGIMIRYEK